MRDPPAGVQFHFDMEQMYPLAAVMLEEDQLLNRMRFDLVPKQSVVFQRLRVCVVECAVFYFDFFLSGRSQ